MNIGMRCAIRARVMFWPWPFPFPAILHPFLQIFLHGLFLLRTIPPRQISLVVCYCIRVCHTSPSMCCSTWHRLEEGHLDFVWAANSWYSVGGFVVEGGKYVR